MEQSQTPPPAEDLESESLEGGSLEGGEEIIDATSGSQSSEKPDTPAPAPKPKGLKGTLAKFNIYIVLFAFIMVIAGAIITIAYFQGKKADSTSTIKTQTLTQDALNKVASSDASLGDSQQILNVLSSAVFSGKVLIRQDLEVAGGLQIGGTVSLSNLSVGGTLQASQGQISKDLSVGGNLGVQGNSSVSKNLQVKGTGSFEGAVTAPQITTTSLSIDSDFTLTHHLIIGGTTPSVSRGSGVGNGGSSSLSGSDTAGNVTIHVGSGASAGCFATISFTHKFKSTPRVQITPVGQAGGAIAYYVTRDESGFSICDATNPPAGASFSFDYFIVN